MPHTASRYMQSLGFPDGANYISARNFIPAGAGAPVGFPTRNAAGDFSWNLGAAVGPITFSAPLSDGLLFRTGFGQDMQEQFGGTGIAGEAEIQPYRPDQIAAMAAGQQLIPRTANKVKGFKPLSLKFVYQISTVALTLHTVRVDKIVHGNNLANVFTAPIVNGANGLATAAQANPYVTTVPFPANQQLYQITDLAQMWIELAVTTAATGAYRLYAAELTLEFNYN